MQGGITIATVAKRAAVAATSSSSNICEHAHQRAPLSYPSLIAETVAFPGHNGDIGETHYARPTGAGKFSRHGNHKREPQRLAILRDVSAPRAHTPQKLLVISARQTTHSSS